jgi:hypothetical protein
MYEHGEPSEGFLMVDLPLEAEYAALDTSQNEDIARKLFNDLNCGLLGPPINDNVIVIHDFEEEDEVREDDRVNAGATPFCLRNSPAPPISIVAADEALDEVQDDINDGSAPDRVQNVNSDGEDGVSTP